MVVTINSFILWLTSRRDSVASFLNCSRHVQEGGNWGLEPTVLNITLAAFVLTELNFIFCELVIPPSPGNSTFRCKELLILRMHSYRFVFTSRDLAVQCTETRLLVAVVANNRSVADDSAHVSEASLSGVNQSCHSERENHLSGSLISAETSAAVARVSGGSLRSLGAVCGGRELLRAAGNFEREGERD